MYRKEVYRGLTDTGYWNGCDAVQAVATGSGATAAIDLDITWRTDTDESSDWGAEAIVQFLKEDGSYY